MARRRRRGRTRIGWAASIALAVLAVPTLFLAAALVGGLVPVNRGWTEPAEGVTVYLVSNGVHADLILPVRAQGLDWSRLIERSDMAAPPAGAEWLAFGAGERRVYLETPTWSDLTLGTAAEALTGGRRIMHVEWVADPSYAAHRLTLRPEEYRRLWASVRAGFALDADGMPVRIDHEGYGPSDAFYEGVGHANALATCNQWVAERLRLAGVKAPLWSPFVQGLTWRYPPRPEPAEPPR